MDFNELEFKQDGTLTKASIRKIEEAGEGRNGTRSFNEVTGETTVVASVGGTMITYVEDGDTRDKGEEVETLDESAIRAFDASNQADGEES